MTPKKDAPRGRGWRYALPPAIAGIVVTVGVALAMTTTDQAMFCGSCHSMAEAALTHKRSVHAELACNECHAPHNLLAKLPFKAQEGLRDFMGNVSGKDIPRPLSARTRDVVNENCKACHFATNREVASMDAKPYCVDCHRNMAHMRHKPISTRTVAYD